MKTEKQDNITIITPENKQFDDFLTEFKNAYSTFKQQNLIINLSIFKNLNEVSLADFISVSNKHRDNNLSFVIIYSGLSISQLPEVLIVVPSLQEAHDIIEMEIIERDLFSQ